MTRRESPVEWTGRAHLVTTSCSECGDSVTVSEQRAIEADQGRPVTCPDCEHDCREHLEAGRNEPATPEHIVAYTCRVCGDKLEFNTRTGEHGVDR